MLLPASVTTAPKEEPEPAVAKTLGEKLNVEAVFAKLITLEGGLMTTPSPPIVAQHDAGAARGDQLAAEALKVGAIVVGDADVVAQGAA
jgi:hypothetical protein